MTRPQNRKMVLRSATKRDAVYRRAEGPSIWQPISTPISYCASINDTESSIERTQTQGRAGPRLDATAVIS